MENDRSFFYMFFSSAASCHLGLKDDVPEDFKWTNVVFGK